MSFDMSEFREIFFEEVAEQLDRFESVLRRGDPGRLAPDDVAELFRCAHSLKGASATFGLEDMRGVARAAEALLDAVRKGRVAPDARVADACLAAGGVLRRLLASHRDGGGARDDAIEAVLERLRALGEGAPPHGDACGDRVERMLALADELAATRTALESVVLAHEGPAPESVTSGLARLGREIRALREAIERSRVPSSSAGLPCAPGVARERAEIVAGPCSVPSLAVVKSAKIPPLRRTGGRPAPKVGRAGTPRGSLEDEWEGFWK